jgi:hypothetical protein
MKKMFVLFVLMVVVLFFVIAGELADLEFLFSVVSKQNYNLKLWLRKEESVWFRLNVLYFVLNEGIKIESL